MTFDDFIKFETKDYLYTYDEELDGWNAVVLCDRTKTEYEPLLPEINGKPLKSLYATFAFCKKLKVAPIIPDSVVEMEQTFSHCFALEEPPVIPNGVVNMESIFSCCKSLKTAPVIPEKIKNIKGTFFGCTSLGGAVEINANPTFYDYCFEKVDKSKITLTGNSKILDKLL